MHSERNVDMDDKSNGSNGGTDSPEPGSPSAGSIRRLLQYFARKLRLTSQDDNAYEPVLDELSLDGIARYIQDGKAKNIIIMAGAGMSTSAGIPDFRSPGTGLYDKLKKYNLPYPEAVFTLSYFKRNPEPFFTLARDLLPVMFKPTPCHYFVRLVNEKGLLLRHYTQNVDTLERVAGLPDDKIVEAHGSFMYSHCLGCRKFYALDWMKERIFTELVPRCTNCSAIVKPDIVFFGETLPARFYKHVRSDFEKCDLLIILGSSLVVEPFASLVGLVGSSVPRLLINREKAGERRTFLRWFTMARGGLEFNSDSNTRDVFWCGDCDEGCQRLADKLSWGEELRQLVESEHKRLDEEASKVSKETI